ncbi:MAG: FeoB-associated Cys-rich membrane protein [Candidatus Enterenecus sp.]
MLLWLQENLSTILVGLALLAAVAAVIVYMVRRKKQGKGGCGCGCSGCAMSGSCHEKK